MFGQVCQSLIVVSYWMPGSPHCQAASAIIFIRSRARNVLAGVAGEHVVRVPLPVSITACMKSSVTRTEWLAFWKNTES